MTAGACACHRSNWRGPKSCGALPCAWDLPRMSRMRRYTPCRQGGRKGTPPEWPLQRGRGGGRGQLVAVSPPGATHDCTGVQGAVQAQVVALG